MTMSLSTRSKASPREVQGGIPRRGTMSARSPALQKVALTWATSELSSTIRTVHRRSCRAPRIRRIRRPLLSRARQVEGDPGSLPDIALDDDGPARLMHEAVHLRQAKAGALVDLLGREEGVEDLGRMSGGMPSPVSDTVSATKSPSRPATSPGESDVSAEIAMTPPSGMASRAFTTRLTIASSNSRIDLHRPDTGRTAVTNSTELPIELPASVAHASNRSPMLTTGGRGFAAAKT